MTIRKLQFHPFLFHRVGIWLLEILLGHRSIYTYYNLISELTMHLAIMSLYSGIFLFCFVLHFCLKCFSKQKMYIFNSFEENISQRKVFRVILCLMWNKWLQLSNIYPKTDAAKWLVFPNLISNCWNLWTYNSIIYMPALFCNLCKVIL